MNLTLKCTNPYRWNKSATIFSLSPTAEEKSSAAETDRKLVWCDAATARTSVVFAQPGGE